MSISWKLKWIERIRLEKLQERIGLEDRKIITIALDVGFSAMERAVERAADRIERAQDRLHQAALEEAEREAAERERHSLRGRWRRFKEALIATGLIEVALTSSTGPSPRGRLP